MKRIFLAGSLILSTLLLLVAPVGQPGSSSGPSPALAAPGDLGADPWPMMHNDNARTGYNQSETALKPPLRLRWAYQTGGYIWSAPAVANGVVYEGASDGKLYAVDVRTGTLKWEYQTARDAYLCASYPTVANDVVYFGSCDNFVNALDAATGQAKWRFLTGSYVQMSPAVVNGVVYVGSNDAKVYALDALDGSPRWGTPYQTGGQIGANSLAVANGTVYVGSFDGSIHAIDAQTGTARWVFQTGGLIYSTPAVANGLVYASSEDRNVYALDAVTGAQRWAFSASTYVDSSPAVANGVVYVGDGNGYVYALDAQTGALRWSYQTGGNTFSSPAVANGVVYIGSSDNKLYALDAQTGAVLWSYETNADVMSSPAVADGAVFVGASSGDGRLYAFENSVLPVPSLFLHGSGATANPPNLFLDTVSPTATTAKYKDSTGVNFAGGNPWKDIGLWPGSSPLSAGSYGQVGTLRGWLGLKNSDDQGTQFDLRAEVYKTDTLIASGETLCITNITRNPGLAKEALVSIGPLSSPVAFNGTTDTLKLTLKTRIGTNPDGTKCSGPGGSHNNAVGLRFYFDAVSRPSRME